MANEMAATLISVVINNHNHGRCRGDAIVSVLSQSYQNVDLVIVDDGSCDDSRAIMCNHAMVATLVFKEQGGLGSALNRGFEKARERPTRANLMSSSRAALVDHALDRAEGTY